MIVGACDPLCLCVQMSKRGSRCGVTGVCGDLCCVVCVCVLCVYICAWTKCKCRMVSVHCVCACKCEWYLCVKCVSVLCHCVCACMCEWYLCVCVSVLCHCDVSLGKMFPFNFHLKQNKKFHLHCFF